MTLSIMEDHDTFKTALKDYQNVMGDIPKILERYLGFVARTGKPLFSWDMISGLILKKFENVCECYAGDKVVPYVRISGDGGSVEELKAECLKTLNEFSGVPFTIQRICELLLTPRQNYSKLDKFLRGFIRVIKVVTTVDRVGQRITTESQSLANAMSPFPMNESGDNWSAFSNHSNESGSNTQSISPTSEVNENAETKCDLEYEDKCPEDTESSLSATAAITIATAITTTAVTSTSIPSQVMYADDTFFVEQKTISMPPIGALFKPIDQLEAFVQNVSSQAESSIDVVEVSKKRPADDSGMPPDAHESPAKKSRQEVDDEEEEEEEEADDGDVVASTTTMAEDDQDRLEASVPSRSCEPQAEEASSTNDGEGVCVASDEGSHLVMVAGEMVGGRDDGGREEEVEPDQSGCGDAGAMEAEEGGAQDGTGL